MKTGIRRIHTYTVYRSFFKTNLEALMSHQVSRFMTKDWCTKLFIIHPIYMNKNIPILYRFKTGSCGMVSWLESNFGTDLGFFCFRTCSQLPTCLIQTPFSIDKTSWFSSSTNLKHLKYMKLWFPVIEPGHEETSFYKQLSGKKQDSTAYFSTLRDSPRRSTVCFESTRSPGVPAGHKAARAQNRSQGLAGQRQDWISCGPSSHFWSMMAWWVIFPEWGWRLPENGMDSWWRISTRKWWMGISYRQWLQWNGWWLPKKG